MMKIEPLGPDAEILGGAITGLIDAINRDAIIPHLEKLDMMNIQNDKWYPKQQYIDLWNSIIESGSSSQDFVGVGMTIAATAWPPEADRQSFDELIDSWEAAFDAVNRGKDRGYVHANKNPDGTYTVRCRTPDPDNLHYGIVYGFCQRFLPDDKDYTVKFDPDVTPRERGGDETVIQIVVTER
jgi:hypothetical protein